MKNLIFLLKSFLVANLLFLFSGCISLTSMQTGRTLGKNNAEFSANVTYGNFSNTSVYYQTDTTDVDNVLFSMPNGGLKCSFGLTEKLDLGINIDLLGNVGSNLKYQIIGNKETFFASSIGFDLGFNFVPAIFGFATTNLSIPLFLSIHPTDYLSIYLTPRCFLASNYFYGFTYGQMPVADRFLGTTGIFINSYGLILGKKNKLAFEISNYSKVFYKPTQFSIGYIYTFNKSKTK